MNAHILLRSGAEIVFRAETISAKTSRATGALTSINWEGARRPPVYVDLSEVVAVYASDGKQ